METMTTNGECNFEKTLTANGNDHGSSPTESPQPSQNSTIKKGYVKFRQRANRDGENKPEQSIGQEPNSGNGFDEKDKYYKWYQTMNEVVIKIAPPCPVKSNDVKVYLEGKSRFICCPRTEDQKKLTVTVKKEKWTFDQITEDKVKDEENKCLLSYHLTESEIVITLTKKKQEQNMWSRVASDHKIINTERVNPLGMPTSQFISIDSADIDESITEKIKEFFNEFPKKPKCLISVHGSINNEKVSVENLKAKLSVLVEETEDILLVTDGLNTGISKMMGEIIKDFEEQNLPHINILAVTGKQDLQSRAPNSDDVMYIDYYVDNALDSCHRWFIFVDGDDTRVKDLRIKIEKSLMKESCVCMVFLGGDITDLHLMKSYYDNDIPIILLQQSGGFSDDVLSCINTKGQDKKLLSKYQQNSDDISKLFVNNKMQKLPSIPYQPSTEQECTDVDMGMFVIKGSNKSTCLKICDLLISLVFKQSVSTKAFERARFIAEESFANRLCDLINFIDMHQGEDETCGCKYEKHSFNRLHETFYLLHYAVNTTMRKKITIKKENLLESLDTLEAKFTSSMNSQGCYSLCRRNSFKKRTLQENNNVYGQLFEFTEGAFVKKRSSEDCPFMYSDLLQELFIWSLMCNLQELALALCRASKDILANCLVAHRVLINMSLKTDDKQLRMDYRTNASKFESFSVKIINKYRRTPGTQENTNMVGGKHLSEVIVDRRRRWNGKSYLDIAIENENKLFVAEGMCQEILLQRWMGKLSTDNSTAMCMLCILFPPLIFFFIQKVKNSERSNEDNKNTCRWRKTITTLYNFYTSPFIVHTNNLISYIVFLLLFTYLITIELTLEFAWLEVIIIIWVVSFLTEEIRQLLETTAPSFRARILYYWSSGWNKMDVASIILFGAGVFCRIVSAGHSLEALEATRLFYAVALLLYYLRILQFFSVNRTLGPRLLMIYLMLKELAVFLLILVVFIISYSIAAYSVAYPNSELVWELPWKVFRLGFWNIYGEFFLNEIEQPQCSFNQTESTQPRCPTLVSRYFSPVLLVVYFAVTNILLLNLLIAVFNQNIEEVSSESEEIWKLQKSAFIREYIKKPALINPFILAVHALKLLLLFKNCCRRDAKNGINDEPMKDKPMKHKDDEIIYKWGKCLKSYVKHFESKKETNTGRRNISHLWTQVNAIKKQMKCKISNLKTETNTIKTEINDKITKETEAIRIQIDSKMKELLEAVQQSRTIPQTQL